jgi:hypothetical protein
VNDGDVTNHKPPGKYKHNSENTFARPHVDHAWPGFRGSLK